MSDYKIRTNGTVQTVGSLGAAMQLDPGASMLVLCPHDDDGNIGAGLTIASACAEGFDVHIAVVTDGRMGYCSMEEKDSIVAIRQEETIAAYRLLGVAEDQITLLGFGDGTLFNYIGRRPAAAGDPAIEGYTGLENALTYAIRKTRPACVLTPAGTDLHPDHQAVYKELLIAMYHAAGDIWPELGAPCDVPKVFEFPIYVALDSDPDIMICASEDVFQKKLESIAAFVSQKQIAATVKAVRTAGPVEFLRNLQFAFYDPNVYRASFEEK